MVGFRDKKETNTYCLRNMHIQEKPHEFRKIVISKKY